MAYTLDTNLPLRLVGIQLFEETTVNIRKSLQPGWYAFIHTKEDIGTNNKKKPVVAEDVCPYGFYNTDEGLPRIYISAIAGKNGSGKSSILDILYRILNNFASAIFSTEVGEIADEVVLTRGLYARLYFEQDGVNRYIDVADDAVAIGGNVEFEKLVECRHVESFDDGDLSADCGENIEQAGSHRVTSSEECSWLRAGWHDDVPVVRLVASGLVADCRK